MHTTIIVRAELIGSNACKTMGITAIDSAPVLAICRKLLAVGVDPDRSLVAYRGATLALRVRSIGEGARLRVRGDGIGFEIAAQETCPVAPLERKSAFARPQFRSAAEGGTR
jgi:hypothetical protein